MKKNLTHKLIESHLLQGELVPGAEIELKIDQTLTQDATGTLVMLELEALELDRVKTEVSVQYVDHNLLQTDFRNADDHAFLWSACQKYGLWYSRPGNGVSHPVHMERFGIPGKTLAGSDSHTPAAGALGMLAIGAGGLDVAMAMAGFPLTLKMPKVLGVKLTGRLPRWVSAKDVVLTMLAKYNVKGCTNKIIEYYGPGLDHLTAMDRHVIANMGTEMGATSSVFPSDQEIRRFLRSQGREQDWSEWKADEGAEYDEYNEIDLAQVVPKIALPGSPGNVVDVTEVAGTPVDQVVIGSSANPGFRDFWIVGQIIDNHSIHPSVSLDINPTSRQVLENLSMEGTLVKLIRAGARIHQSGCMGCIGMGQAPGSDQVSLRTMPRNFPGRSGTVDDKVYLCSPETGAASALTGKITDPRDLARTLGLKFVDFDYPEKQITTDQLLQKPAPADEYNKVRLKKGPNIKSLPGFKKPEDSYSLPVSLKLPDNVSTDEILQGGALVLPYRSNIPKISKYAYAQLDRHFYDRALKFKEQHGGHFLVAGENYAQGSSREHAALAVKYLGQVAVMAKSYARIGWQNLINYGIIPFEFTNASDYEDIHPEDMIGVEDLHRQLKEREYIEVDNARSGRKYRLRTSLSDRQKDIILSGGLLNHLKEEIHH